MRFKVKVVVDPKHSWSGVATHWLYITVGGTFHVLPNHANAKPHEFTAEQVAEYMRTIGPPEDIQYIEIIPAR